MARWVKEDGGIVGGEGWQCLRTASSRILYMPME